MSQDTSSSLDGRVQRGERNRQKILEALFELVGEGILRPTAEQVAERAGVGTRTVFRHFDDMESLLGELHRRVAGEFKPSFQSEGILHGGTIGDRIAAAVEFRTGFFERIAPFKRSGNLNRWRSPTLQRAHAEMVKELRGHLLASLPELDDGASETADALELLLSFEAWDRLRTDQRLGKERARAVLEHAARALVADL
ncbi:MAG: transcriptional regulator [Deltaproteobacteria bacterium]|nr:transcriptional regulator [Deltaproteobacteria bacterium]